jgi:hypothetical protein
MLRNYIKTAFRSLLKNKTYSLLNIGGLAIGIACAAFIFLWVADEMTFDSVHEKKDRLYIVKENQQYVDHVFTHSSTPGLLGPSIQDDIPGIANTCRMSEENSTLFTEGERSFYALGKYADPSVFSMFTLPFVQGDPQTAFQQLHAIVLTEASAKKFFGTDKNIIGKSILADRKQDYIVTGVVKDMPTNSSITFSG